MTRRRVAVMISGRGSNMAALLRAAEDPSYPAEIVGVISDRNDAQGLESARRAGIEAVAVPFPTGASRDEARRTQEAHVADTLRDWNVQLLCLAGYMRVLSPAFVDSWHGRILNIHPSLLPAFPGLRTHERAIERGVAIHGCTVHFVTSGVDEGPIIAQAALAVRPDDSVEALSQRVLRLEHALYPLALADVSAGRVTLDGETVRRSSGQHLILDPDCTNDMATNDVLLR